MIKLTLLDSYQLFFRHPSPPTSIMSSLLSPLQQGCLDAYAAACNLMPPDPLHAFILIGGAATIAQGAPERRTKDVNIAVSLEALVFFWSVADNRRGGFCRNASDESFTWDVMVQGTVSFQVGIELAQMPGSFVSRSLSGDRFRSGFVATISELVRLRASTLVGRGDEVDYTDFGLLLRMAVARGVVLPYMDEEELGVLMEAVEMMRGDMFGCLFIRILSRYTLAYYGIFHT